MKLYTKFIGASLVATIMTATFGTACSGQKKTAAIDDSTMNALVLGTIDGKDINYGDLSDTEKNAAYKNQKQFYDATENLLAQHYFNLYLEEYRAKNKLKTLDDAKKHFYDTNAKVSKNDVSQFIKDNKDLAQLKQIPEDKRESVISNYLNQTAQSKATQSIIQTALKDGKVVVKNVQMPAAPKYTFQLPGYSFYPNAQVPVTIVEFADYQCPYCVMAHNELQKVLEHYNKKDQVKVQFVYYDFPLSFHDQAQPASIAAYCASEQGQFWPMHDKIFTRQPRDPINADTLAANAKDLKLDMVAFKKCQEDKKSAEVVNAQMAEGMRVGVQGTPSLFINGVRYEKQPNFEGLKAEIDALL